MTETRSPLCAGKNSSVLVPGCCTNGRDTCFSSGGSDSDRKGDGNVLDGAGPGDTSALGCVKNELLLSMVERLDALEGASFCSDWD